MRCPTTPIGDEFERITEGEIARSSPGRRPGGEWDPWFALAPKTRRRLIGAGFAGLVALEPDVLADIIERNHPGLDGEEPMAWYYRTALKVMVERRTASKLHRRNRLTRTAGYKTEYEHRTRQARAAGYDTFWQYRQARQWSAGKTP